MKFFFKRAALFILLFACMAAALEAKLARANRQTDGRYRIGDDVYDVLQSAELPHDRVTTLYLGDSVARQLFHPHTEPSPDLLYLPSNQAISLAGQYCLLQEVIAHAPNLRHVYLFYTPRSWANDLDQIFTHDYFCGYFHSPEMVWEIWNLQHNTQLTEAHIGRMIFPNIMAENSYLNRSQSSAGVPLVPSTPGSQHPLSRVSVYFVGKMKSLCNEHRITLAILPCPCLGSPGQFANVARMYDAPITFYDADLFLGDQIHLKKPNVAPTRQRLIREFHLNDER